MKTYFRFPTRYAPKKKIINRTPGWVNTNTVSTVKTNTDTAVIMSDDSGMASRGKPLFWCNHLAKFSVYCIFNDTFNNREIYLLHLCPAVSL